MTHTYPVLADAALAGKRVLLRAGFDVPMKNGVVEDASRVESLVPTMQFILEAGASLVILAHQGRPKGKPDPAFSQRPLVALLQTLLGVSVGFAESCTGAATLAMAKALQPGDVLLLENLRFDPREEANDPGFAKELASLGDVYVNDAFTNCHRAHASMVGLPKLLPAYMGLQLQQEVEALSKVTDAMTHPFTLIVGGAKMETKIPVIQFFLDKGDDILVGGAVANTFLAGCGFPMRASLYEQEFVERTQEILLASEKPELSSVHIPSDAVVALEATEQARTQVVPVEKVGAGQHILDVGPRTVEQFVSLILQSSMIVWNGPLGYCEAEPFTAASKQIAQAIAQATARGAVSIVGGGDTLDFHTRYQLPLSGYTFVSMGGGAMLEFVSGNPLPALEALAAR